MNISQIRLTNLFAVVGVATIAVFGASAAFADRWVEKSERVERSAMSPDRGCEQVNATVAEYNEGVYRLVSATQCQCKQLQNSWYACWSDVRYQVRFLE